MKNWVTLFMMTISLSLYGNITSNSPNYVWAYSGLNLRVQPGTNQNIITKLAFGDSLLIIHETDISFNITGIKNVDSTQYYLSRHERKAPYILYGKWVKVSTYSGVIGYVVNQYLLPIPPYGTKTLRLKEISRDTVVIKEDGWPKTFLHKSYYGNIESYDYINEKYYEERFIFPRLTMQQVFVILNSEWTDSKRIIVHQNWKDSLSFSDGGMCYYEVEQLEGYVQVVYSCSC